VSADDKLVRRWGWQSVSEANETERKKKSKVRERKEEAR
jgi:hypothetical protein